MQANNQMEVLSMKANKRTVSGFMALFLIIASQGSAYAQKKAAEFDPALWDLERAKIVDHLGRKALIGSAFLKDARLQNGVIEVDIATTERSRSYPGLLFRVQDAANYERVYVRPHRSPFYDDVLQYGPVFNGVDSWQLYNGPGLTAGLEVLPGRWNHLKILVAGKQAQVFWNDLPEPVLVIDDLARGDSSGTIGLVGPMDGTAFFSNLNYEKDDSLILPPRPRVRRCPASFPSGSSPNRSPPSGLISPSTRKRPSRPRPGSLWPPTAAALVDVSRTFPRKFRAGDCVLARTTLAAESDSLLRVNFGYSDIITVFLNGRPLYSGNAIYQSRDRSFLGIVGYYDDLFLPLKKGDNELLLLVGETMGGWGFCFRRGDEVFSHAALKKEWSTKNGLALPEAVVFDPKNNVCYVSNYFNEGREFISKLSTSGEIIELEWIKGLRMPTGMCLKGNTLYAVDRSGLNVIDIKKREITKKIPLPGLRMANDVAMDRAGNLYISDTAAGIVYRYAGGKLEPWLENLSRPNALLCEKDRLLVGQNEKLIAVNLRDKATQVLARFEPGANIDGIEADGSGGYLVGDHNGRLYRLTAQGERTLLLDTTNPGEKIADFAYIPKLKRLIIPNFDNNTLTAYSLDFIF